MLSDTRMSGSRTESRARCAMVWVDPNMDWNVAASATECDILSDRDAALASRAGRKLEALIEGTDPVPARFGSGAESVDIPRRRCGFSRRSWTRWRTATAWR